jgi:hypothetical protein
MKIKIKLTADAPNAPLLMAVGYEEAYFSLSAQTIPNTINGTRKKISTKVNLNMI